eukprot:scaffold198762_cov28-Tisochrysis_lutea.AAC.1
MGRVRAPAGAPSCRAPWGRAPAQPRAARDALRGVQRPRSIAVLPVRRDERDHRDDPRLGEERCDLRGATDGLCAVLRREAQVSGEAGAQVVAVDAEDVLAELVEQPLLERLGDRRLARAREPRHPERDALLPEHPRPVERVGAADLSGPALCDVEHWAREHALTVASHNLLLRARSSPARTGRSFRARKLARRTRGALVLPRALWAGGAGRAGCDGPLDGLIDDGIETWLHPNNGIEVLGDGRLMGRSTRVTGPAGDYSWVENHREKGS